VRNVETIELVNQGVEIEGSGETSESNVATRNEDCGMRIMHVRYERMISWECNDGVGASEE